MFRLLMAWCSAMWLLTGFATDFEFIVVIVVDFSVWLYVIPGPVQLRCSCSSRQNSFHRRNCAYHLRLYFVRWGNQTGNTILYITTSSIGVYSLTLKKEITYVLHTLNFSCFEKRVWSYWFWCPAYGTRWALTDFNTHCFQVPSARDRWMDEGIDTLLVWTLQPEAELRIYIQNTKTTKL